MTDFIHSIVSIFNTALYDYYIIPLFLIVAGIYLSIR